MVELIDLYVKYYKTNSDKFFCLHSGVAIEVLKSFYNKFLFDSGITPIEELKPDAYKWLESIADAHPHESKTKLDIIKSAYALELIVT